jgi:hypothetical protein
LKNAEFGADSESVEKVARKVIEISYYYLKSAGIMWFFVF